MQKEKILNKGNGIKNKVLIVEKFCVYYVHVYALYNIHIYM